LSETIKVDFILSYHSFIDIRLLYNFSSCPAHKQPTDLTA